MELRVLKYFLSIAQEESISKAAQRLHITQPTLSRQIMDLEDELGKQLIIRSNKKISLTDEGLVLRKRAEEILRLVEKTESEITASDEEIIGDVYIGSGETAAMHLLTSIAKELRAEGYEIRFHIHSGNSIDVMERLDKGLLDFGLLIGVENLSKYNSIRLPVKDTWGVAMRCDSPLAEKSEISEAMLKDLPLIISKQSIEYEKQLFKQLNVIATYNLIYNAALMVEDGIGYAICLDRLLNTSGSANLCFRPISPRREANIDVVWKKYQMFSKPAELFLSHMRSRFENS